MSGLRYEEYGRKSIITRCITVISTTPKKAGGLSLLGGLRNPMVALKASVSTYRIPPERSEYSTLGRSRTDFLSEKLKNVNFAHGEISLRLGYISLELWVFSIILR